MLPLIYHESVERYGWLDRDTFVSGTTLAQGAPGANAINTAVFIGYQTGGTAGALLAAAGITIPSLAVITALGPLIFHLIKTPLGSQLFKGLRAGILGLLAYFLYSWLKPFKTDWRCWLIFTLILIPLAAGYHPILVMLAGGLLGFLLAGRCLRQSGGDRG
jgi:chromate transporter